MSDLDDADPTSENTDQIGAGTKKPDYMTAKQFNEAQTKRERQFEKRLLERFEGLIGDRGSSTITPPESAPKGTKGEPDGELAEMRKLTASLKRQLDEQRAETRKEKLDKRLSDALHERGVIDPELASAYLRNFVRYEGDKSGAIVWHTEDDVIDLDEGLDSFFQSERGQRLLPPKDVSGTGERGNRQRAPGAVRKQQTYDPKDRASMESEVSRLLGFSR